MLSTLKRWIFRLPNYTRAFGFGHGVRLMTRIERRLPAQSGIVDATTVPGYAAPVHLRRTIADHSIFWQCLVLRQYLSDRFPQYERLRQQYDGIRRSGRQPVIIDAGGNIGLASLWFAREFPLAKIVTVEPHLQNFRILERNLAHLKDRVSTVRGAVSGQPGSLYLTNPEAGSTEFRYEVDDANASHGESVTCYTFDELVAMVPDGALFIAKIDIEGGQKELFRSNVGWLE